MRATVSQIEHDLHGGGVRRYAVDTYYGGGEWVLLAAWLGWYYVEIGEQSWAREILEWVEHQADEDSYLPEQIPENLIDPSCYQPWVDKWGEIASPLLWSHAEYIILHQALNKG
jgi:GH15 family glucan-1,4-alpha-glucosidase